MDRQVGKPGNCEVADIPADPAVPTIRVDFAF